MRTYTQDLNKAVKIKIQQKCLEISDPYKKKKKKLPLKGIKARSVINR